MLSIRLSRVGKKKQPHYRIVVMEKSKDPWSNYIEKLGNYVPQKKEITLNKERIQYWIEQGAELTNSVHNLLVSEGVIKADKKPVSHINNKRKAKLEEKKVAAEEAKKAAAEEAKVKAEEE